MKRLLVLLLAALGLNQTIVEALAGETNLLFYTPPRTPLPGETVTITFTPAPGVKVLGVTFLVEVDGRRITTPIRFEPRTNNFDRIPPLQKKRKPDFWERQPMRLSRNLQLNLDSTERIFRSEAPGPLVVLSRRF